MSLTLIADSAACQSIYVQNNGTDYAQAFTSFPGNFDFNAGNELLIQAFANPGYTFLYWEDGNGTQISDNPYVSIYYWSQTLTAVFSGSSPPPVVTTATLTINADNAVIEHVDFVNNAHPNQNQTIYAGSFPALITFNVGDTMTVSAYAIGGYHFSAWVSPDGSFENFYLIGPSVDWSITAEITANPDTWVTLTLAADAGCDHVDVTNETTGVTGTYRNLGMVNANFSHNPGDVIKVQAFPVQGYTFMEWDDANSHLVSASNPYSAAQVNDETLHAVIAIAPQTLTITANFNECDHIDFLNNTTQYQRTITASELPAVISFQAGQSVTLRAWPKTGHNFSQWIITPESG